MNKNTKLSFVLLPLLLLLSGHALAISTGIVGQSGNPNTNSGSTCGTVCHTGGVAPTASLTGPTSVEAGSTNTFTLSMSGGQNNLGGFNISATGGSLASDTAGIGIESGELRHTQAFNVGNDLIEWTFEFTASASPGNATLYAAVVSANGNSQMTGDAATAVSLNIEVTAAQRKLPPAAVIGGPFFGQPGESLNFDASGSTDGDGTIARFLWDFGDGSGFEQGAAVAHSYANEEIYALTVAVTDNDGLTSAIATTVTISANAGNAQGAALYNQHCLACHGTAGTGGLAANITGTTVDAVNGAIINIPAMQSINLTANEVQLIVDFIAAGGGEPPTRPTDGPGLYNMFCSACHGADGRGGSETAVTGAPLQMIIAGIADIPAMQNISLSLEETQLIADFLVAGGAGSIPINGKGLYDVFCLTCHGDGGHGGKFFAITGASNEIISEAIANIEWMQPLNLNNTQIQSIANYLGAGGEPPLPLDNKGLYDIFCAVCHGAGGHGGKFFAVTGAPNVMITDAIANEAWMDSLQLTTTQTQQIADYLSAGGEPPLPDDGAGLYTVFCEICHGPSGQGGKHQAVTGAANEMIEEAIAQEPLMGSLSVTPTQIQSIANYLGAGGGQALPTSGGGLYDVFCAVCHGNGGHGGKFLAVTGAPRAMINNAISNEPWMDSLSLNATQINSIAGYLLDGGGGLLPTSGRDLYQVFCSICHGADGRGGKFKVVTGTSLGFVNDALNNVNLMSSLQLNSTQRQSITTFLASGGGAKPTTGSGLYHVFCETCHGPNGTGGPEESITGESASEINSAIADKSDMRQLAPYLTTSGSGSDTAKISNFLGGQ
jgi:cytochrome c